MSPAEEAMVRAARNRAEEAHSGQTRKGSEEPYFNHPKAVAMLVQDSGGSAHEICAAYLHDVVEDTDVSISDFPWDISETVLRLSHTANGRGAKYGAIEAIRYRKSPLLIKMCDRIHNLSDNTPFRDKYASRKSVEGSTYLLLGYAKEVGLDDTNAYVALRSITKELWGKPNVLIRDKD